MNSMQGVVGATAQRAAMLPRYLATAQMNSLVQKGIQSSKKLTLNVLPTRVCNADCPFCIEKTKADVQAERPAKDIAADINALTDAGLVSEVLLLGGEPLYYRGLEELCKSIKIKPIITTNGCRLMDDPRFLKRFSKLPIAALNISVPHYEPDKRVALMRYKGFSNQALFAALRVLTMPVRINTLLVKKYIDSLTEMGKMILFARQAGVKELAFKELTASDPALHDFIADPVLAFNAKNYVRIKEICDACGVKGNTVTWKTVAGLKVLYTGTATRDLSTRDHEDFIRKYGPVQRVLFNDGKIGFTWRREDGVKTVSEMIQAARS